MDLATYNNIKTQTEAHIASGAGHDAVARNAELLSARLKFEFHPLICDIVEAAFTAKGQPVAKCRHTSGAARAAAEADFKASSAPPPEPKAAAPRAKVAKE